MIKSMESSFSDNIFMNLEDIDPNAIITIDSKELLDKRSENNQKLKITEDGKIVFDINKENKQQIKKKRDVKLEVDHLLDIIESMPKDLTDHDINNILEFLCKNIATEECGRIYPYNVEMLESSDIRVTLIIYNGGKYPLQLPLIALRLMDANDSVIIADIFNVNAEVSCGKVGIYKIILKKESLSEKSIDLSSWSINFTV